MIVKHLEHTDFDSLMACFLSSFENYFVKMPTNHNYYKERWQAAKVKYDLSYGMFDNDKLVGFIINAIDDRFGHKVAFNTGTGVIPEYRGRKIVKSIYDYAIPDLVKNGITKCELEVIVENEKAIKAYKSIGFKICKHYKCFGGALSVAKNEIKLKEVSFNEISWKEIPNQDSYSWDFHNKSLKRGDYKYYYVISIDKPESFFSINTNNGTINQLEVLNTEAGNWERLFSAIQSTSNQVRIINVDDTLKEKLSAIEKSGLKNTVNQYEMELTMQTN